MILILTFLLSWNCVDLEKTSVSENDNSEDVEYINENGKSVFLHFMGDSLRVSYSAINFEVVLHAKEGTAEIEGIAIYSAKTKFQNVVCEVSIQFLDYDQLTLDSDCKELSYGMCNAKSDDDESIFSDENDTLNDGIGSMESEFGKRELIFTPEIIEKFSPKKTIELRLLIDADGNVKKVENRSKQNDADHFVKKAVAYAYQLKFKKDYLVGEVWMNYTFEFPEKRKLLYEPDKKSPYQGSIGVVLTIDAKGNVIKVKPLEKLIFTSDKSLFEYASEIAFEMKFEASELTKEKLNWTFTF